MRTVSLQRRVVAAGVLVVAALLAALDVFLYVTMKQQLRENLEEVLASRAEAVRELVDDVAVDEVPDELLARGIQAVVELPDGTVLAVDPSSPRLAPAPPGREADVAGGVITEVVAAPDGGRVVVAASTAGVDATLTDLRTMAILGTVLAVLLSALLLSRTTRVALQPLDDVVTTARRIAGGRLGERLRPDQTGTEIGRLAVAFDEMLDALEEALADAQASDNLNREFLADVAHQLRTPITGIRASAELLARGAPVENPDRLLANLVKQSDRVSSLLNALLRMAQLDQGEALDRHPADLVEVCRLEVDRTRELSDSLAVRLAVEGDVIEPVDLDPSSMQEALGNILDNCRRHALTFVQVLVRRVGDTVEVRVTDDGPGMDEPTAERAFQRFVSLDPLGGSGLGLPIAKGIVQAHGGDLTYEDQAFVIRLPARRPVPARPE